MQRRSVTTGLIVKALRVLQGTVRVLSNPEFGTAMRASGTDSRRVAWWRMRTGSSRSDFMIVPLIFFNKNKSAMMSGGQG